MAASKAARLFLITLLPLMSLLLYIEGQDYDPALIRFDSAEQSGGSLTNIFPPEISGYIRIGQVRSYVKENLYEYVNGHAEYFISAGFTGLAVGEYGTPSSGEKGPDVVVDVYDMGKSLQAFGILSDESGGRVTDIQSGLTGFRNPRGISFTKGQYYVKISSYNESIPLENFIASIAAKIGAESDPFPEFARLPAIGEIVATRFFKEAYRGLDFANNVIEREYTINSRIIHVFIVTGNTEEIGQLSGSFIDYFEQSDIDYRRVEMQGRAVYQIKDPYEGDWVMIQSGNALFGIYGGFDDTIIEAFIKDTE